MINVAVKLDSLFALASASLISLLPSPACAYSTVTTSPAPILLVNVNVKTSLFSAVAVTALATPFTLTVNWANSSALLATAAKFSLNFKSIDVPAAATVVAASLAKNVGTTRS